MNRFIGTLKDKAHMYSVIISDKIAGNAVIEPNVNISSRQINIGFSNVASDDKIYKYYMIGHYPDYIDSDFFRRIRKDCLSRSEDTGNKSKKKEIVNIDFFTFVQPYKINWDSNEMRNRMSIWRDYFEKTGGEVSVFEERTRYQDSKRRKRICMSTKYINESDLENKRALAKVSIFIKVSAHRDTESILGMIKAINKMKVMCTSKDVELTEIKVNLIDWIQSVGLFSLRGYRHVQTKLVKKVMTDDNIAELNGYKQGIVGENGVCLGMDVLSGLPVFRKFKEDPDGADNWLIAAATGGGKSYFVKGLLSYLMADGFVETVIDYEGDEYSNYANYIRSGNPDDVKIISMGKGSAVYFDPMEIPELTGDSVVDDDLKESAENYTLAVFRIIVAGLNANLQQSEERVVSSAIHRIYSRAGVNDDKRTWIKSKGLRIRDVYNEIKEMVKNNEGADALNDNLNYKAACKVADSCSIYFEDGEIKAGTFKQPMSANELYRAKFIVFSFGMKGANSSQIDPTILALKQLSVANISNQISNYCKYVRHCFNVKVWEEYQRWGEIQGSAEIITNAMTGGRKRGDVNFMITNDLATILDNNNAVAKRLRQNIQNYAIGKITDVTVRNDFCKTLGYEQFSDTLSKINTETNDKNNKETKYSHAFCLMMDSGKAVVKVDLPDSIKESNLFKTGVIL